MTIIKIASAGNGGHENQTSDTPFPIPDGYALLPEEVGTPETLENYPFGEITVAERDGVPTVSSWTPLPMPEIPPTPVPESSMSADVLAAAYLAGVQDA